MRKECKAASIVAAALPAISARFGTLTDATRRVARWVVVAGEEDVYKNVLASTERAKSEASERLSSLL